VSGPRKPKILLVEDQPAVVATIAELLSAEGYELLVRRTGRAALAALDEELPDAVLLDLGLPDMDGLEVCYSIKSHPFSGHVPVLVLTARSEDEALVHAFEHGADDFVAKPIFLPELLARLRSHLRTKALREQLEADRNILQQILQITGSLLTSSPEHDIFHELIHQLSMLFDASRVSIVLPEQSGELLRVVSTTDFPLVHELKVSLWKYPEVQKSLASKEVILVQDTLTDELMAPVHGELRQAQVGSILVIPILSEDGVHGALLLKRHRQQPSFGERDVWLCRLITQGVAALLRNYDLHRDLQRNLQQLKDTRDRLLQSERLSSLGQFVAGIAHELNNPLMGIISFSQLLLKSHHSPFVRQSLGRIAHEAERCRRVVRNLLTFTRTHTDDKEPMDLNAVVESVLESRHDQFRTARIELVAELDPALPPVLGSVHQFEQVLYNLTDNALAALAHASVSPRLSVSTCLAGGKVELRFEDNGPGMRDEVKQRIFEPFFTTKAAGSGTGLGLSIVKGIVEEHGGSIAVQSESGRGAHFLLQMPAHLEAPLAAPVRPQPATLNLQGEGRAILLVDDEPTIREALGNFLRLQRFEVHTAASALEALELCRARSFDALLLDLRLPDLSGSELYRRLVALRPELRGRFLLTSGNGMCSETRDLVASAGEAFLAKPFTFDELTGGLERALSDGELAARREE
jgi:signal transduction histidine kinase